MPYAIPSNTPIQGSRPIRFIARLSVMVQANWLIARPSDVALIFDRVDSGDPVNRTSARLLQFSRPQFYKSRLSQSLPACRLLECLCMVLDVLLDHAHEGQPGRLLRRCPRLYGADPERRIESGGSLLDLGAAKVLVHEVGRKIGSAYPIDAGDVA